MPSSGYRKQTMDFGDMALDLQKAAASFTQMSAAAASFVSFVGAFKAFELQVTKVNSAVGGTAKTFKDLSDAARNFALVSKYSAGEAASSMVMLAQAGFSAEEAMSAMPAVLQLAQASMENLDLVADTVASTIRTYNLEATDATRVTNLFAASAVNSLATVNKLAFSFRQVGPVAAELGLSVEQTAAALDILYNRGLRGEQAGTALRNILIRLIKPTKETYDVFYRLGIALNDSNGKLRDYQDILKDLGTKRVSDMYLTKMFGREALAGAKTLIAATTGEYEKMLDKITDTDTAARMANAQMRTMDGSLKLIKNSLTELGIIIGESFGPVVKRLSDAIQNIAITLRTTDKETLKTIKNLAVFTSGLYLAAKASTALYSKLGAVAEVGKKINTIFTAKNLLSVFNLRDTMFANGNTSPANLIKMWRAGQGGGSDWYERMYEIFRSFDKVGKLSPQAAAQIKAMSKAELVAYASSLKLAGGLKAVGASLKVVMLGFAKLAPLMLVAWGAFKLYDGWVKEREKQARTEEDLFPELTQLPEKLKEAKLAINKDLPDIKQAFKDLSDVQKTAVKEADKAAKLYLHYALKPNVGKPSNYNDIWGETHAMTFRLAQSLVDSVRSQEKLTYKEFEDKALAAGFESTFARELWDAYEEGVVKQLEDLNRNATNNDLLANTLKRILDKQVDRSIKALEKASKTIPDSFVKSNDELQKAFSKVVDDLVGKESFIADYVTTTNLNKSVSEELISAVAYMQMGVPPGVKDPQRWIRDNYDAAIKRYAGWLALTPEEQNKIARQVFSGESGFGVLSPEAKAALRTNFEIDADVNLQAKPLDLNSQKLVIEQLKKQYEDLLSDYTLSWELLSQSESAYEKVAKLQREIETNNATLATTVDKIFGDLFKEFGKVFDAEAATKTLEMMNKETGELGNKVELIKALGTDISEEQRAFLNLKLTELELQAKILAQRNEILEKDKEIYEINEKGNFKRVQGYKDYLDEEIKKLDKKATTDFWSAENFANGIEAGVLEVAKGVDSSYEMMKKGMQGFADFMADSMNDIVDAWGKGWDSMKSALKNTLADMLKDLAHYYMKQAIYTGITSLSGSFSESPSLSWGVDQFGNAAPKPIPLPSFKQAKGGAWTNGLQTFAKGGVVSGPTLFNHRFGTGLMGEAGPEAIMPLKRDSQGRLGIAASGSSLNYAPIFNINMTTGTMDSETSQRNTNRMTKELDNKVKNAVLLVLAKEKRPGGILYAR